MLKGIYTEDGGIQPYKPGEPILESERITQLDFPPILGDAKQGIFMENKGLLDELGEAYKPKKDDYKALSKGLEFLKFREDEAQDIYNLIGGAINLASSITTAIAIVNSATELARKLHLFGLEQTSSNESMQKIGKRIEQIYEYLKKENLRSLNKEAIIWRSKKANVDASLWNAKISRAQNILEQLDNRTNELDTAILSMLESEQGDIAFQKSVYNYKSNSGHWIDAAGTAALTLADGRILPSYRDESSDLQTSIWDPGYYLDVLVSALHERLNVAMLLEPAFRSTAYDRDRLLQIANALQKFIEKWRASILVANPVAGISKDNTLYNPLSNSIYVAEGILIGAVDPVTGISSLSNFEGFEIERSRTYLPGSAWGGRWDYSKAVDPEKALSAAMNKHVALVDSVIQACGISSLSKLELQYRILASTPTVSEFVRLPNAKFQFHDIANESIIINGIHISIPNFSDSKGTPETIDLGKLKPFAANPNKTYPAMRFHREIEKTFKFKMARRAEWSKIQLGYRLRIAEKDFVLCPFSGRPPEGIPSIPFPNTPIEVDYHFNTEVYDCCQIRHFSANEEDKFEKEGESSERVFNNMRKGRAHIKVSINFEPLSGGDNDAHSGEVIVTIRNLEANKFPDSFIIKVSVFETRYNLKADEPVELEADWMTIHMTPSYLVVGQEFIDDYWDAFIRSLKTIKGINDKLSLKDQQVPTRNIPEPAWSIRDKELEIENGLEILKTGMIKHPDITTEVINYFRPPLMS
ncbi:TPA: hypothetical protein ACLIVI_004733 [Bacillus pacificus]|uniref:hypothetical protein n=1 Tax=Bacillus cereus group TaxID=86661 RepID=UPI000935CC83|nr:MULTISPECIES: hypothetical protein [Bacillus cereus group]MDA1531690.1 hypothetical protein [Bacillus cereus group sp. TH260-2LC]MDF9581065.1 hypothetical protein [Bacillus paranthracis]MDG1616169.1 hypothetical protein [Bacillus paranthracis]MDZ4483774.1 hypothetical protein [Bacillus cereus]HDR7854209.1 hypothetical protein [Bacillus paranthracis]